MYLTPEARCFVNLLRKFDCMTIGQIKKLFSGTNLKVKSMISYLCDTRVIRFVDDNYAMLQSATSYSPEVLYCLWVMLDKIENKDGVFAFKEMESAHPCDNGIEICFLNRDRLESNDGADIIEYITFIDKTSVAKLSFIQDTFYSTTGVKRGEEELSRRRYTFVVTDEDVMDTIANMQITVPFMIAYIECDLTDSDNLPVIEYYVP